MEGCQYIIWQILTEGMDVEMDLDVINSFVLFGWGGNGNGGIRKDVTSDLLIKSNK